MGAGSFVEALNGLHWRFAKTMPQWTHWYIVREPDIEELFVRLFERTKTDGVWESFYETPRQYWYAGDGYKYWRMTDNLPQSRVINRCKEGDHYPPEQ